MTNNNNRLTLCVHLIIPFILISFICSAQSFKYTTQSKSAISHYEKGLHAYDLKQNVAAVDELILAIRKDTSFIEAYILLASVYEDMNQPQEAVHQYIKSFELKPDFFTANYTRCANLEIRLGQYNAALLHYSKYLTYPGLTVEKRKLIEKNIADCNFAIGAIKHPAPFNPENLGQGVNTADAEYYFTFSIDQQTLLFTRHIKDNESVFGDQEDFFMSHFKNNIWETSIQLPPPLNSKNNEGAPSLSIDGKTLFFAAKNREGKNNSMDIYLSQQIGENKWMNPINIGNPINTTLWESQPSFSSDGKTLFFTRVVISKSGHSNSDIFYSVFQADRTWSEPKPLNENINTDYNEESAFIHPDNQTLYFCSEGHEGFGGLDIYISRRQSDGEWGKAINLGYPINTSNDENSFVVSADGLHAYFSSDRPGGFGKLDIYVFDLYKEVRPLLTNYVKGKVVDALTKLPLSANFEILDVETGKVLLSNVTDRANGEFTACLPTGKSYMLNVSKDQYLFHSENFECRKDQNNQQAFQLAIELKKPAIGETVVLKNIFFDVNKYELKPESFTELTKLIDLLTKNSKFRIEIGGHTDNTGDKKNNIVLSENRAKSVYDYLLKNGIPAFRLTFKGYGDEIPVDTNETEEGRYKNRRTDFKLIAM